jgi:multiple antibiotic resistance protein
LLLLVLGITLLLLLLAGRLRRVLGNTGANIISRVMGMILATVAVDSVLSGLEMVGAVTLAS